MSHDLLLSRRNVLRGGGALMGGLALAGCSFFETEPEQRAGDLADPGAKEAKMLSDRVKANQLPKLEDRLPKNPFVMTPQHANGIYGGTLRAGGTANAVNYADLLSPALLMEWSSTDPATPVPALVENVETEQEGRVVVFHLREGLKWSDGQPFTTDDIMFQYENVLLNKDLNGPFPAFWMTGGKPSIMTAEGPTTFRWEFVEPHGLLLRYLCFSSYGAKLLHPKHYLSQFHPAFSDQAKVEALAKEEGFASWPELYFGKRNTWRNPEAPTLNPWIVTAPALSGNSATAERNPYYWKVDPDGRQLPYIDKVNFTFLPQEQLALRAANGDLDLVGSGVGIKNIAVVVQNEAAKPQKLLRWKPEGLIASVIFNVTHPDPVLKALFEKDDFRAGASLAINRQEINEALLAGQGRITQAVSQPEDANFQEGMGKRYLEHDVAAANAKLDAAGLTRRGGDGMRLRPDGRPLKLICIASPSGVGVLAVDMMEFVKKHWAEVGLAVEIRTVDAALFGTEQPKGEYDLVAANAGGYMWDMDGGTYIPATAYNLFAPKAGAWYFSRTGSEPTGDLRQLQTLYDQMKREVDDAKRTELGRQVLRMHDEKVWLIGVVAPPVSPVVVNDDLDNLREGGVWSYYTNLDGAVDPEQLYFTNPAQHVL